MNYIQNLSVNPSTIKVGDSVTFTLSDGSKYFGRITRHSERGGYYVEIRDECNYIIFAKLGISAENFVQDLVGYPPEGSWPETRTLEELGKVLDALLKVNKPGEPKVEEPKAEEPKKPTPPSEWDWLLG